MLAAFKDKERPLHDVPLAVIILLLLSFGVQLMWHSQQDPIVAKAEDLPAPLSSQSYAMSSLGEPVAMAKLLNLWLQAFDNQPGLSLSFHQLDYQRKTPSMMSKPTLRQCQYRGPESGRSQTG